MTTSQYEHIKSGKVFELNDEFAAGIASFKKVQPSQAKAPAASTRKPKATKPTSSKEGN